MKQSALLKLPFPLHAQLKALAKTRDTTMVQLIADLVDQAAAAGEIPDAIPGFIIDVSGNRISLMAGADRIAVMTADEARDFADTLESVTQKNLVAHVVESGVVSVGSIRRRGTGISIEPDIGDPTRSYVVAPSVALSLARQIRKSASAIS